MKQGHALAVVSILGLAALIFMLTSTSPTDIGPSGVLLFFTTLFIAFFGFIALVMKLFCRLALGKTQLARKDFLYSAILAFGPIMLLMARSFNAINFWTVGLIALFLFLAEFLVAKRT